MPTFNTYSFNDLNRNVKYDHKWLNILKAWCSVTIHSRFKNWLLIESGGEFRIELPTHTDTHRVAHSRRDICIYAKKWIHIMMGWQRQRAPFTHHPWMVQLECCLHRSRVPRLHVTRRSRVPSRPEQRALGVHSGSPLDHLTINNSTNNSLLTKKVSEIFFFF